jgi:hypothetical protein
MGCMSGARGSRALVSLLALWLVGCTPAAQAYRLNPEQSPERYRVTCKKRFLHCEQKVKELCDKDFQIIEQHSTAPEQPLVAESDLSSTGPKSGPVDWVGELVVVCGRDLPPLRLVRNEDPATPEANPVATPNGTAPKGAAESDRVCVPGVTQACLGPGACSGAQACLPGGEGFGACDCGPVPAPVKPTEVAPAATQPAAR